MFLFLVCIVGSSVKSTHVYHGSASLSHHVVADQVIQTNFYSFPCHGMSKLFERTFLFKIIIKMLIIVAFL